MPSMVVILEYSSTWLIFLVQERITCPFRMMEHEPQTPVPHPTLTPVRPIRRRTSAPDRMFLINEVQAPRVP